jgi:conjugative transfer pilus assembly protein TraH
VLLLWFVEATSKATVSKNDTKAAHYKNQLAGHFSLGGSSRRIKVSRIQPVSVQKPHIKADCSGIDVFLGGVNYIDTQYFIDFMKNVGSSARSYAFALALETVSPQIASTLKYLTDMAQKMNLANISSCEAAASLVGAVVPRSAKMHQQTCTLLSSASGRISDWVAGKRKCGEAGKAEDTRNRAAAEINRDFPDVMHGSYNVAWEILSKHSGWSSSLKETIMSITGTVLVIDGAVTIFAPKALEDEFFNAFAEGGKVSMYKCEGARCLTVTQEVRTIQPEDNHAAHVRELLDRIEDKIYEDTPLDEQEVKLIQECQIPILKIINIMSAYHRNESPINLQGYAEIIAHDLLNKHFKDLIEIVRYIAANLKDVQMNAEPLQEFVDQIKSVQEKLMNRNLETHKNIDQIFKIIEKTRILEKSIYADMRTIVNE